MNKLSLIAFAVSVALVGCATPPQPDTPTGGDRSPVNTASALREYGERALKNRELANENAQQKIIIAAQAKQAEELKTFIATKLYQQEANKPKGIVPAAELVPVAKTNAAPDLASARILSRLELIEQRLTTVQAYLPKLATTEEVSQLRAKLSAVEMRFEDAQKPAISQATSPAQQSKGMEQLAGFRFESDKTLLHLLERWATKAGYSVAFVGQHDLPIVAEMKTVEAFTFKDAFAKALAAYQRYDLNIIFKAELDDAKKIITVTTALKNEPMKAAAPAAASTGFVVREGEKSLVQVLVRWADQAGYTTQLNNVPVDVKVFPSHPAQYMDPALTAKAVGFKTQVGLKAAIGELSSLFVGVDLPPFTVSVDEANKRLTVVSLGK